VFEDIDFSEFHPLDHPLHRCQGYPGGWRRHLSYRWQYQWKDAIRAQTLCRCGRHRWITMRRPGVGSVVSVRCLTCSAWPTEPQRKAALVEDRGRWEKWTRPPE
jgi:hypothetical protein